ncbi:uncharacterized protein LOC120354782 [Nilaparvata lugens]|uniref:uncharacterized protein LOC120354782 n=1 Tax=Nilaparvata lugens TaxID=108931 RepID=UPI00193CA749|nr:uncharacterized protein LOC120354782 [Nilaparvata lugens]
MRNGRGVEELWICLKTAMLRATEETCGKTTINTKLKRTRWWNVLVMKTVREKKHAWRRYLEIQSEENRRIYVEKTNNAKRIVREAKCQSWEEFGEKIQATYTENRKQFWSIVEGLRGRRVKPVRNIRNRDGVLISKQEEVLKVWKEFFEEKFRKEIEEGAGEDEQHGIDENLEVCQEITQEEVINSVKKMKLNKASGLDRIFPEMVKYGGNLLVEWIWLLFRKIWDEE